MSRNMFWKFYFLSAHLYLFKMRIKFDRMHKYCFFILTYIFLKKIEIKLFFAAIKPIRFFYVMKMIFDFQVLVSSFFENLEQEMISH